MNEVIDPPGRLLVETAYEAIIDAGKFIQLETNQIEKFASLSFLDGKRYLKNLKLHTCLAKVSICKSFKINFQK